MQDLGDKIEVRKTKKGKSIFSIKDFTKDEIILEFENNFLDYPGKYTLCIDINKHQYSIDANAHEKFINHSCNPNGYINFQDLTCRALRLIKKGEEITFNYLTTEWDLANKFDCECGSLKCHGRIKGFKYLTLEQQKELGPFLSLFLRKKLNTILKGIK